MKRFSKIILVLVTVALLTVSFAACGLVNDTEIVEAVKIQKQTVLTIADDIDISGGYFGWYFSNAYNNARAKAQSQANSDGDVSSAITDVELNIDINEVKKEAIDNIAKTKMACLKAKEEGITLTSYDYKNIDAQIEQYRENMLTNLKQQGINISYTEYLNAMNTNPDAVAQAIEDEYLAALYYSTFVKDDYVTVKHILVQFGDGERTKEEARTIANDIKSQLDSGADFDKLMNEKSEDTGVGGKVNNPQGYTFTKDGSMVAPFEAAAFTLSEGSISDLVTVEGDEYGYEGFHILKRVATNLSDIAPALRVTEEIEQQREKLIKDIKTEETAKMKYFENIYTK